MINFLLTGKYNASISVACIVPTFKRISNPSNSFALYFSPKNFSAQKLSWKSVSDVASIRLFVYMEFPVFTHCCRYSYCVFEWVGSVGIFVFFWTAVLVPLLLIGILIGHFCLTIAFSWWIYQAWATKVSDFSSSIKTIIPTSVNAIVAPIILR